MHYCVFLLNHKSRLASKSVEANPVAEWLRLLIFSALNRSSCHHCGLDPRSGHM